MESYGQPELLEKKEYETHKCYFHLSKDATSKLRENLNELGEKLMDAGIIAMLKNGEVVIEIPLNDGKNCCQLKMNKEDFRISHSIDDFVIKLDVNFLMMRIGGVTNSKILRAFKKDEVRFILDQDDDFDLG